MNQIFLYDGDFTSFIALVVELFKRKIKVDKITTTEYQKGLFDECIYLEVKKKEENVDLFQKVFPKSLIHTIYYVFLSDDKEKETTIYQFMQKYFIYKNQVFHYRTIDCINRVIRLARKVGSEAHKLKGFLRFKELDNEIYYGVINPTNNVITILANHFQRRLRNEYWIIHDEKRSIYALYNKKEIMYVKEEQIPRNLILNQKEEFIEDLWKNYFKTIAIKERKNLKCQQNFMPKKYWKNIIEMEDNYEESNSRKRVMGSDGANS